MTLNDNLERAHTIVDVSNPNTLLQLSIEIETLS